MPHNLTITFKNYHLEKKTIANAKQMQTRVTAAVINDNNLRTFNEITTP